MSKYFWKINLLVVSAVLFGIFFFAGGVVAAIDFTPSNSLGADNTLHVTQGQEGVVDLIFTLNSGPTAYISAGAPGGAGTVIPPNVTLTVSNDGGSTWQPFLDPINFYPNGGCQPTCTVKMKFTTLASTAVGSYNIDIPLMESTFTNVGTASFILSVEPPLVYMEKRLNGQFYSSNCSVFEPLTSCSVFNGWYCEPGNIWQNCGVTPSICFDNDGALNCTNAILCASREEACGCVCTPNPCGNGVINAGEACDKLGNINCTPPDTCNWNCTACVPPAATPTPAPSPSPGSPGLGIHSNPSTVTANQAVSIEISVTDSVTGLPLSGVYVELSGGATGNCTTPPFSYVCYFTVTPTGAITVTASKSGHNPGTLTIPVSGVTPTPPSTPALSPGVTPLSIGITFVNPSTINDLTALINQIIKVIYTIAFPVVILLLIIAGYLFLAAGGDAQKVAQAKRLVFYALGGLLIIILSLVISALIDLAFG